MIAIFYPKIVRDVCEDYAHLFRSSALQFAPLCAATAMALFGIDSVCEGARVFPNSPCVSSITDALKDFDAAKVMKRAKKLLMENYSTLEKRERLIFVVDDTAIPKSGKTNYAVGHWCTSNHQMYHGQKVVVLAAVDTKNGAAFPVAFRFALKSESEGYKPAGELVIDMVDEVLEAGFPKRPLVADSGFDSKDLINACSMRGIDIYVEMKCNRKVRHATARTIPKKNLETYFRCGKREPTTVNIRGEDRKTKYVCTKHAYISERKPPVQAAAVFNTRCGYNVYGYFMTTNMSADGRLIWEMSRHRWAIEVLFRDLKQNFALGKLRGRSRQDAETSICIPFILITHIRLMQINAENGWSMSRLETIGTTVTRIRNSSLNNSIKVLSSHVNDKHRNCTAARRSEARVNKKPANSDAGAHLKHDVQRAS